MVILDEFFAILDEFFGILDEFFWILDEFLQLSEGLAHCPEGFLGIAEAFLGAIQGRKTTGGRFCTLIYYFSGFFWRLTGSRQPYTELYTHLKSDKN